MTKWVVQPKGVLLTADEISKMSDQEIVDHYERHVPAINLNDAVPNYGAATMHWRIIGKHNLELLRAQQAKTTRVYELAGFIGMWLVALLVIILLNAFNILGH